MQSDSAVSRASMVLSGQLGLSGTREVFLGFATGALLSRMSFADVLDEVTGRGYQRRFCREHSLGFKRYIQEPGATTFPLTFNLRPSERERWRLERHGSGAHLVIDAEGAPVMAQVDCQHRLGYLRESPIPFAFMAYIGLSVDEEMRIFRDINGKAKGLSSSLIDYTEARLTQENLAQAHPEIALALRLQEDMTSPWFQRLDLGGERTTGPSRVASLRTMQKAIRRFIRESKLDRATAARAGGMLVDFWKAVVQVYPYEWSQPRRHLINKGIGVYALMSLAGTFVREAHDARWPVTQDLFVEKLSDLGNRLDWSNQGPMKGFGGSTGADRAFELMTALRLKALEAPHGQ